MVCVNHVSELLIEEKSLSFTHFYHPTFWNLCAKKHSPLCGIAEGTDL